MCHVFVFIVNDMKLTTQRENKNKLEEQPNRGSLIKKKAHYLNIDVSCRDANICFRPQVPTVRNT